MSSRGLQVSAAPVTADVTIRLPPVHQSPGNLTNEKPFVRCDINISFSPFIVNRLNAIKSICVVAFSSPPFVFSIRYRLSIIVGFN